MKHLLRLTPHVRKVVRYASVFVMLVASILAVAVVVTTTIDLGPSVRRTAESAGSKYIERPMHIGRLSIHLFRGRFVVEDFVIDGVHPGDRPFFTAKQLSISLDWSTSFQRQPEFLITSVEMTDWQMLVEKWQNGHNFPKFTRDSNTPDGPKRFTTTLRYFRASRGQFSYEDHETPWSIVCPNLDLNIGNLPDYHGEAVFNGGTVTIQNYVPMWANMRARFSLDGARVHLSQVDLDTDGAKTVATGDLDLRRWPEQHYDFKSRVDFPRMQQVFFSDQDWHLTGAGDFAGMFQLTKEVNRTGRELSGTFKSELMGWRGYAFPALRGSLRWTNDGFDVWNAEAKPYGGDAQFAYSIKPLGQQVRPTARFDATYRGVDVAAFTDVQGWPGLRFSGSASGHNLLEWPLGRFGADRRDEGTMVIDPPAGVQTMTDANPTRIAPEWGPFVTTPLPKHVPVAADVRYSFDQDQLAFEPSYFATGSSYVSFEGATAWGQSSRVAFHVNSRDWQESDQLLAGIITDFGSPTSPVPFGGRGQFDGVMTGPFRRARVEGRFSGQDLRAWDTQWGDGTARIIYENGYITVANGSLKRGDAEILTDGLFSLSAPRDDGGEEINARFRATRWDLDSLRHAFQFDDYPFSGRMSGDFHLTGQRARPVGFGSVTLENAVAWRQSIEAATAALRFDGMGVRFDALQLSKGGGTVTGAAFIGYDATYSFYVDGRGLPLDRIELFTIPSAPVAGVGEFTATGNGTFEAPRNDIRFRVSNFSVAHEELGQMTGQLTMRGSDLIGQVDAASPRLTVTGTGRLALAPEGDSEITLRFHDSLLDPWVRLFAPKLSASTTAVASGSLHFTGSLEDMSSVQADATVDTVDMRLFDYAIKNAAPVRLSLDKGRITIRDLEMVGDGDDMHVRVSGGVGLSNDDVALQVAGDGNLGLFQSLFRDIRSSGRTQLTASIKGTIREPVFSGNATITDGRIRHFSLPNALDAINGSIAFDAQGIRFDEVTATIGGGPVEIGGRISLKGFAPDELDVTMHGENVQLRPTGVLDGLTSAVDADLSITGSFQSPLVGGTIMVRRAVWARRLDAPGSIFDFTRTPSGPAVTATGPEAVTSTTPLRLDIKIVVPSTFRVQTNLLRMSANADLALSGTLERPVLLGHVDVVDRGEVNFEGRRYRITRGSIDFNNPNRIEPFFDVEMETNVRVPGSGGVPSQTYRIIVGGAGTILGGAGTAARFVPTLSSEPPLPASDVLALLLSDARRSQDVELQRLQNPNQAQTDILTARATQALTGTLSSEVGKVVEQTFGVDTFQLTPSFIDPFGQQTSRLNPTARLTIGKRISDRVYLTFSRSLGTTTTINDQIVLLEYEQSERLSWIFSRNEDQQTYALEIRVRQTF